MGYDLDLWEHGAYQRHQALQIPLEKLLRNRDIVIAAIGAEWCRQQARRLELPHINITDMHSLYSALKGASDTALTEICELGDYLSEFKNEPAIGDIIKDLKSDKYLSVLAELACAYRWKKAGATIALRPPVPAGEADYSATLNGFNYTVEVSAFPDDDLQSQEFRLQMIVSACVKSILRRESPVIVKTVVGNNESKTIENDIRELANRALTRFRNNPDRLSEARNEYCEITVERLDEGSEQNPFRTDEYSMVVSAREHGWTSFLSDGSFPEPSGPPLIQSFRESERTEHARLFFKFPPSNRNPYDRLKKKLKKEVRQLAGIDTARIVILDASGVTDVFELDVSMLFGEMAPILRNTPELAAVWIVMRKWTTAFRHKYFGGYFSNPDSVFQIPRSFLAALAEYEFREDFVGCRKFESAGFERDHLDYARRVARPRP